MSTDQAHEKVVISLGGSLIVPQSGIDVDFLSHLNQFIRDRVAKHPNTQIFLVIGGGQTARDYRDAGRHVLHHELVDEDLDWLGIHAIRLNAHLIRSIFRDIAHPVVLDRYDIIRKVSESVVVCSAWRPGWSSDYCAVMVADDYDVKTIINLSNIERVYTADPKKDSSAKPIDEISWPEFQKLVGTKWIPGMNAPFDPIATKRSMELGLKVVIMKGNNLENLQNYLDGKEFVGTLIK